MKEEGEVGRWGGLNADRTFGRCQVSSLRIFGVVKRARVYYLTLDILNWTFYIGHFFNFPLRISNIPNISTGKLPHQQHAVKISVLRFLYFCRHEA